MPIQTAGWKTLDGKTVLPTIEAAIEHDLFSAIASLVDLSEQEEALVKSVCHKMAMEHKAFGSIFQISHDPLVRILKPRKRRSDAGQPKTNAEAK